MYQWNNKYLYAIQIHGHICLVKACVLCSLQNSFQHRTNFHVFLVELPLSSDHPFVVFTRRRKLSSEARPTIFELCQLVFHFVEFLLSHFAKFLVHTVVQGLQSMA